MNYGALNSTIDEKTAELIAGLTPEKRGAAWVWYGFSDFVRRKPLGAIGAIILFTFIGTALVAPQLATYDPDLNNYRERAKPPSAEPVRARPPPSPPARMLGPRPATESSAPR